MPKLRIFEVKPPPAPNVPGPVQELETVTLAADSAQAKEAATQYIKGLGLSVRSISWGPPQRPGQPPDLIAYASKGVRQ